MSVRSAFALQASPVRSGASPVWSASAGAGGRLQRQCAARAFFEPRFGHDFSQVSVHHDAAAAASARSVAALAYTVGEHLVFDTGRYAPESFDGRRLLAHELTHVVQQQGGTLRRAAQSSSPQADSEDE